jgi:hypothetical protein
MLTKPNIELLTKLEKEGRAIYRLKEPLTGFYLRLIHEIEAPAT